MVARFKNRTKLALNTHDIKYQSVDQLSYSKKSEHVFFLSYFCATKAKKEKTKQAGRSTGPFKTHFAL